MPRPFDARTHVPPRERAAGGDLGYFAGADSQDATSPSAGAYSEADGHLQNAKSDPAPAARRSPLEHERDAGQVLDPASEVAWLRKIGIASAANLIEALVAECSREFARGYEVGRAVGAVEGPRPMTDAEVDDLLGVKREGKA